MTGPRIRIRDVRLYERPVRLRLPFRFGVTTLTHAPQAFVRILVENDAGHSAWGMAAELMVPKWFDKDTALSNEDNFRQLRTSISMAREAYLAAGRDTAFGFAESCYEALKQRAASRGLNGLVAGYGPALLNRAVADGLCRLYDVSFENAVQTNLLGLRADVLAPDLKTFDLPGYLSTLSMSDSLYARHTVGMADALVASDRPPESRINDSLPETLEEVIAAYGQRYFKLKIGGDPDADIVRLSAIAQVLDRSTAPYYVTLDGNEQLDDADEAVAFWRTVESAPGLQRLAESILFIEQPIRRTHALSGNIHALARHKPVLIDESGDGPDAFVRARECGYEGVSSKTCKGMYQSLLNAARCAFWNTQGGHFFLSGEDLTTQAGLAVQQDLALVSLLGLKHVERNGHHYVDGFSGGGATRTEADAFNTGHGSLYSKDNTGVHLHIQEGRIALDSLRDIGFASHAQPDWEQMAPMKMAYR